MTSATDPGRRTLPISSLLVAVLLLSTTPSWAWAQEGQERGELAPVNFYQGPVQIQRISGTIQLQNGQPPRTELTMLLTVPEGVEDPVRVGFRGAEQTRVGVEPGARQEVRVQPVTAHDGEARGPQSARVDLMPMIDGQPIGSPVGRLDIGVLLPRGVPALLRSSPPLERDEDPASAYALRRRNAHPSVLRMVYTGGPSTLRIRKTLTPSRIAEPGPVEVSLFVRNEGPRPAPGILLEDSYDARDFRAEGPAFRLVGDNERQPSDRRIIWSQRLEQLPVGADTVLTFTLEAQRAIQGVALDAAKATIEGRLVGVSNKVRLENRGSGQ